MKRAITATLNHPKFELCSIIIIIFASLMFVFCEDFDSIGQYSDIIEVTFGVLFAAEYSMRVYVAKKPFREVFKPLMLVDLFCIFTVFSPFVPTSLAYLRAARVLKVLSIFRTRRYRIALQTLINVCRIEKEAIVIISVFFVMLVLLASGIMRIVEGGVQPGFSTISRSMWWTIVTVTSVGYGDLVPITPLGKIIAGITAILGILIYSMMTAIFATGFSAELRRMTDRRNHENRDMD